MKRFLLTILIIALCSPEALYALGNRAVVIYVTDGDTLKVMFQKKKQSVRLIGIDAPESRRNSKALKDSARSSRDIETIVSQGKIAKKYVKTLVKKGDSVRIAFDIEKRDRYRRLLAYVYLADGKMLNDVIIRNGYASPLTIPPNVRYRKKFLRSYHYARENRLGLWKN
ncbi:MAG TPA: thermonuclease family protein [Spirochaetota bacterium]|nr:thermonuclease family protein [Spirochaetota bacterium]